MRPGEDSLRSEWARWYVEQGIALVVIEPGNKIPKGKAWQRPGGYYTDAAQAEAFWSKHPKHNMGPYSAPVVFARWTSTTSHPLARCCGTASGWIWMRCR